MFCLNNKQLSGESLVFKIGEKNNKEINLKKKFFSNKLSLQKKNHHFVILNNEQQQLINYYLINFKLKLGVN